MKIKSSVGFLYACEELHWNHERSTPHRSETNGIAEQGVRRVKERTSSVLVQSGLQESWCQKQWRVIGILEMSKNPLADGQTPQERRFNSPYYEPIIPFGAAVKNPPNSCKRPNSSASVRHKRPSWEIHGPRLKRGEVRLETKQNPTDRRVLMVGLLVQPENDVGPDDVAELHLWSSWRLHANAPSQWDKNPETVVKNVKLNSEAASCQLSRGLIPTRGTVRQTSKHRNATENTPKMEKMRWELVTLHDKERREDGWLETVWRMVVETSSSMCLAKWSPNAASSLRQAATTSMCTAPGGAACSAPSNADSSPTRVAEM